MDALFSGQGSLQGEESGILAPNSSYRSTQGAIRHDEDTEFNDALRGRGIIPTKEDDNDPSASSSSNHQPSAQELLQARVDNADLSDDEDLLALEADDIPSSLLEKYRNERLEEVKKLDRSRKFGDVIPIGRESYTRDINEASEVDVEIGEGNEELKGKGTGVVCFLWKDGIPESELMSRHLKILAHAYPSTKFVSIRGDMCIANYPDKNIPTLLIYRKGGLIRQVIGLGAENGLKGMKTGVVDVEALLILCDAVDPFLKVAPTAPIRQGNEDDDSDSETDTRRRNGGIRRTLGRDNDSDEDLDM